MRVEVTKMDLIPWSAVAAIGIAIVSWLGRLHYVSNRASERLGSVEKDVEKAHQEVGLTNSRVTVVEKDIIEVRSRAITRDDLKEIKSELSLQIDGVAIRMESAIKEVREDLRASKSPSRSRTTRS